MSQRGWGTAVLQTRVKPKKVLFVVIIEKIGPYAYGRRIKMF